MFFVFLGGKAAQKNKKHPHLPSCASEASARGEVAKAGTRRTISPGLKAGVIGGARFLAAY